MGATVGDLLWGLVRKDGRPKLSLEVIESKRNGGRVLHTNDDAAKLLMAPLELGKHPVYEWYIDGDKIVVDIGLCRNKNVKFIGDRHVYYCGVSFATEVRDGAVCRVYKPCNPEDCPLVDKERRSSKE